MGLKPSILSVHGIRIILIDYPLNHSVDLKEVVLKTNTFLVLNKLSRRVPLKGPRFVEIIQIMV